MDTLFYEVEESKSAEEQNKRAEAYIKALEEISRKERQ